MIRFDLERKTPVEINRELAKRLKAIRKKRKLSQQALSDKSGVSLGSLKRFERSGEVSLLSFSKLVYALELSNELDQLFTNLPPESIEEVINGKY